MCSRSFRNKIKSCPTTGSSLSEIKVQEGEILQGAVICIGKIKESFMRQAADEYKKRLSRFVHVDEIELPDLPEPVNSSTALENLLLQKEGASLLSKIKQGDYVIALCIEGRQISSEAMAAMINDCKASGRRPVFIIGGSLGLSNAVKERANEKLSLSKMTFPHQLARVMLLEQWYRAEKINANERYHK